LARSDLPYYDYGQPVLLISHSEKLTIRNVSQT